jgi:tetratricopeptide (TPR) repeat protein
MKPDLWNIEALCGQAEAKTGRNAEALVHLREAFLHVTEPTLRASTGQQLYGILFQAGKLNEAAEAVGDLERLEPNNIDILYAERQVYSLMASHAFVSAAELDPSSARMYEMRGDRMAERGNMQGAIAAYRLAIKRDPHLSGAHFVLGEALSASSSPANQAEAKAEFEKALADNPLDERAECRLGEIDIDRSDIPGATSHFKRALELQPDDPGANEGMGLALLELNSNSEALTYLKRAVALDPTNAVNYYHLSQASRKLGDSDAAWEMQEFLQLKAREDHLKRVFNDLPIRAPQDGNKSSDQASPQ